MVFGTSILLFGAKIASDVFGGITCIVLMHVYYVLYIKIACRNENTRIHVQMHSLGKQQTSMNLSDFGIEYRIEKLIKKQIRNIPNLFLCHKYFTPFLLFSPNAWWHRKFCPKVDLKHTSSVFIRYLFHLSSLHDTGSPNNFFDLQHTQPIKLLIEKNVT